MTTIKVIVDGKTIDISCHDGENLMRALNGAGILVPSPCAGRGICRKCRVLVDGEPVLACQTIVDREMTITHSKMSGIGLTVKRSIVASGGGSGFGLAIDLGTTTVAYYLIDLSTGFECENTSSLNPQSIFGADVISRIESAMHGNLDSMRHAVVQQIGHVAKRFAEPYKIQRYSRVVIAGNPTMLHILNGINPQSIGFAPYQTVFTDTVRFHPTDWGFPIDEVILMPQASAFLGGDTIAGVLASEFDSRTRAILIDLGTNGEMVLSDHGILYGCSTATGPAFEGANIECGMGGVTGAINRVAYEHGHLTFGTVEGPAKGIAGPGLVDLVAILVAEKIVAEDGAFQTDSHSGLRQRLDGNRFYITDDIFLSQRDIRQFQLAKSAVASGILTLVEHAGIKLEEVDRVHLAGGFGFYLGLDAASSIGMFPASLRDKIVSVGNASGAGAIMCTSDLNNLVIADDIAQSIKTIELSRKNGFVERFVDNLSLSPCRGRL